MTVKELTVKEQADLEEFKKIVESLSIEGCRQLLIKIEEDIKRKG